MKKMKEIEPIKATAITPFDKESKENLRTMKFKLDRGKEVKVVSDKVGEGRFIK